MSDEPENETGMNEIAAAAHDAKRTREAAAETEATLKAEGGPKTDSGNWPLMSIGIGIGVGSAALAAALLYAHSSRKK